MDNVTTELFEVVMDVKGDVEAEKALSSLTKLMKILKVEMNENDSEYLRKISKEVEAANKQFGKLMSTAKKTSKYLSDISNINFNKISNIKGMNLDRLGLQYKDFAVPQVKMKIDIKTAEATNKLETFTKLLLKRGEITEEKYNKMMNSIANSSRAMSKKIKESLNFEEPMRQLSGGILKVKDNFAVATGLMDKGLLDMKEGIKAFNLEDNFKNVKNSMLEFIRIQDRAGNKKFNKYEAELRKTKFNIDEVTKSLKAQEEEKKRLIEVEAQRKLNLAKAQQAEKLRLQQAKAMSKALLEQEKKLQNDLKNVSTKNKYSNEAITPLIDKTTLKEGVDSLNKYKESLRSVNEYMLKSGEIGLSKYTSINNAINGMNESLVKAKIEEQQVGYALDRISSTPLNGIMRSTKLFGVELNKTKKTINKLNLKLKLEQERKAMLKNLEILKKYDKVNNKTYSKMKSDIKGATLSIENLGKRTSGVMTRLGELSSSTRALFVNLTRAFIAIQIGKSVIEWTDKVEKLNNAVFQLKQFHGYEDLAKQMDNLNSVTGGVINKFSIMSATNKAIDLGVDLTSGKLLKLARMVTIVAQKYGTDATKMFEDFTVAIGKANPIVLDNIGIILKKEQAYKNYFETMYKGTKTYNDWLKSLKQTKKNSIYMQQAMEALEEKTKGFIVSANESQTTMAEIGQSWDELSLKLSDTGAISTIIKLFKHFVSLIEFTVNNLNKLDKAWVAFNNKHSDDKVLTNTADDYSIIASETQNLINKQKKLNKEVNNYKGIKTEGEEKRVIGIQKSIGRLIKDLKDLKSPLTLFNYGTVKKQADNLTKYLSRELKLNIKISDSPSKKLDVLESKLKDIKKMYGSVAKGIKEDSTGRHEVNFLPSFEHYKELKNQIKELDANIGSLHDKQAKSKIFLSDDARAYNKTGKVIKDYIKELKDVEGISINKEQSKRLKLLEKEFDVYGAVNHEMSIAKDNIAGYRNEFNREVSTKNVEIYKDISDNIDKVSKSLFGLNVDEIAHKKLAIKNIQIDKNRAKAFKELGEYSLKTGNYLHKFNGNLNESAKPIKGVTQGFNNLNEVTDKLIRKEFSSKKVQDYFNQLSEAGKTSSEKLKSTFANLAPILNKYIGKGIPTKIISNSLELLRAESGLTVTQLSKVVEEVLRANNQGTKLGIKWINIIALVRKKLLDVTKDAGGANKKIKKMVLDWYSIVKKAYSLNLNPADKIYENARFQYENNLKLVDEYIKKTKEAGKGFMSDSEYAKVRELFKTAYDEKIKLLKLKDLSAKDLTIKFNIELGEIKNENLIDDLKNKVNNSLKGVSKYALESTNIMRYVSQSLHEIGSSDINFEAGFTSLKMFNKEIGNTYKDIGNAFKAINDLKKDTKKIYDIELSKKIKDINDKYKEQTKAVKDNVISITKQYNTHRKAKELTQDLIIAYAKEKKALDDKLKVVEESRKQEISIAEDRSYLNYINEIKESLTKLFNRGKELNLSEAIDSLNKYTNSKKEAFSKETMSLAQDEVNSWQAFNSDMWSYATIYEKATQRYKSVGESMISDMTQLGEDRKKIIFDGEKFSFVDAWAKGLTPEKIQYMKEALKSINSTGKNEFDKFSDAVKSSSDQIGESLKSIGSDIGKMLAQFAGQKLFAMITDTSKMDMSDKLKADMSELNIAKEKGLIDQEEFNQRALKLQEDHDLKLKQMSQQAKRDALIQLGSLFFNKGLGYLIEAPAIAFGGTNGLGNPVAAGIYAATGVALMGLGATLGAYGAGIQVPQQGSSVTSTKRASSEGSADMNFYLYNEVYHDRRDMDRNISKVASRNSSITYGG